MGCYIWYSEERTGRGRSPPSPLLAVPNVIAHPSTANVSITVLLYNGPLIWGFNVRIKGLICGTISGVGLASGTPAGGSSTSASDLLHTDNDASSHEHERDRKHDVFISYRRQTGKHLAGSVLFQPRCWSNGGRKSRFFRTPPARG